MMRLRGGAGPCADAWRCRRPKARGNHRRQTQQWPPPADAPAVTVMSRNMKVSPSIAVSSVRPWPRRRPRRDSTAAGRTHRRRAAPTTSEARTWPGSTRHTACSTASPAAWPKRSLIGFRRSTSSRPGCRWRLVARDIGDGAGQLAVEAAAVEDIEQEIGFRGGLQLGDARRAPAPSSACEPPDRLLGLRPGRPCVPARLRAACRVPRRSGEPLLRGSADFRSWDLVFLHGIRYKACPSSPRRDSPFVLPRPWPSSGRPYISSLSFWIREKKYPNDRARRHHHGQPVRLGDHAACRRDARRARRRL